MRDLTALVDLIKKIRSSFDGFNPPAREIELSRLQKVVGQLPAEVLALYRDHDGSKHLPKRGGRELTARLMPIAEVLKFRSTPNQFVDEIPKAGKWVCLWTDDNSNWCGIYTDGPLRGWITVLDHENPMLVPAFRSTRSFLAQLLVEAPDHENEMGETCAAYNISQLTREIPVSKPDANNAQADNQLASRFRQLYEGEQDEELRRLYAFCSICLTPYENTKQVCSFVDDTDWRTPVAAIRLLEMRRYVGAVKQLEVAAREGVTHRSCAAILYLVRLNTRQSKEALARLKMSVDKRTQKVIEGFTHPRHPLPAPRWE